MRAGAEPSSADDPSSILPSAAGLDTLTLEMVGLLAVTAAREASGKRRRARWSDREFSLDLAAQPGLPGDRSEVVVPIEVVHIGRVLRSLRPLDAPPPPGGGPELPADGGGNWRAVLGALVVIIPVLLLATGLWVLADALERKLAAEPSISPKDRWLAPAWNEALERIAFGSCLDQRRPQPVWQAVIAQRPQLMLMLGDNVYGDVKGAELAELKAAYAIQAAQPELAAARAAMPFLATWDDHDYGLNDAAEDFPWKRASRRVFADFWQLQRQSLPAEGVYRSVVVGPEGRRVRIILLDLRTFRSRFAELPSSERRGSWRYAEDGSKTKTMLGEAQWAWLETELQKPAELRILVSSTQLLAEAHAFERWGHLPAERQRLFDMLRSTDARGTIVISGDRHRSAIYERRAGAGVRHRLVEVTSSALNRSVAGVEPVDPGRLTDAYGRDNFGMLRIDWAGRRMRLAIHRADDGGEEQGVDIGFGELGL